MSTLTDAEAIERFGKPRCRGCHRELIGRPYCAGGIARIPETMVPAKSNYYGGWVCSRGCDYRASLELEQSMPGHGYGQQRLDGPALRRIELNWGKES